MASPRLSPTKKALVRMSLVTGSTLATIIGAQSLAALDKLNFGDWTTTPAVETEVVASNPLSQTAPVVSEQDLQLATGVTTSTTNSSSAFNSTSTLNNTSTGSAAAPSITILRRPGQANTTVTMQTAANTTTATTTESIAIAPPSPVQLAAPAPVIVQAPSAPAVIVSAPASSPSRPAAAAAPAAPAPQPATRSSR